MSDQTPPEQTPAGAAVLPPAPPSPTRAPIDPSRAVAGPAIALAITAGLDLLGGLFLTFASFLSLTVGSRLNRYNDFDHEAFEQLLSGAFGFVLFLGSAALSALIVYGAIKMMQLQSWGLSMTAAILAVIPCISSPCCIVGIPFGIWALVVLHRPEVRQAFS